MYDITNYSRSFSETNDIKIFVLDEADEMLSRGFKDKIYDIFRTLPDSTQVSEAFWINSLSYKRNVLIFILMYVNGGILT